MADAAYVFRVQVRLSGPEGVWLEPATFETTLYRAADPPGEDGWLFFRDNLWHGEVNDPDHMRELAEEALGVDVLSIEFAELRATDAYLTDFEDGIAENLEQFRADAVSEVLSKYLGSSIHVVDEV